MNEAFPPLDDMGATPLPQPLHGVKLFQGDLADWKNNACPHWYASRSNWSLIADGYRKAANALVERVADRKALADEMLYPVCFLYRHYAELCLKEIILLGNRITFGTYETEHGHNLETLWQRALHTLKTQVTGMREEDLITIGMQFGELQKIDPGSDEFRYPSTKRKEVALDGLNHVNLRHMRDVMAGIATVLDGSVAYLFEVVEETR